MPGEATLGDLGERRILDTILAARYGGIGDDCALLPGGSEPGDLVATTDSCPSPLVALLGDRDPYHAGWLLATINLSDLAAAGALPLGLLTTYTLPAGTTVADFERLLAGVDDCCAEHGTRVVGGDLRDGDPVQLSATAVGRCLPGRRLSRRGGSPGDRLLLVGHPGHLWASAIVESGWTTGPPGARPELDPRLRDRLHRRSRRPLAQLGAGRLLAAERLATACLDVSDGLYPGVRALCRASGLGAALRTDVRLEEAPAQVCRHTGLHPFALAQTWGDWCLLAAVPPRHVEVATDKLRVAGSHVVDVGALTPVPDAITLDGAPWQGTDQERFSTTSWHGGDPLRWLDGLLVAGVGARAVGYSGHDG